MTDRQITHGPGCWDWGPRHYECALQEIKLMTAEWERVFAAKVEAEARAERLAEVLRLAEEHINAVTPEWYSAGQRVLAEIRTTLKQEGRTDG